MKKLTIFIGLFILAATQLTMADVGIGEVISKADAEKHVINSKVYGGMARKLCADQQTTCESKDQKICLVELYNLANRHEEYYIHGFDGSDCSNFMAIIYLHEYFLSQEKSSEE